MVVAELVILKVTALCDTARTFRAFLLIDFVLYGTARMQISFFSIFNALSPSGAAHSVCLGFGLC